MHIRRAFTQRAGFVLCRSPSALFPRALFPRAPLVARKQKRSFFLRQVGFEPAVGPGGGAISASGHQRRFRSFLDRRGSDSAMLT